ncbi:glycosyltransferase family 2 protein [Acidobacteria bacterium AH-259-D05]|nr:glycosyltransferase family 2 protein [Acidobacteria bacterium AH-259-D05]
MSGESPQPVLVSLVTRNDESFLARCLESVQKQTVPVRVKVFDNASEDGTPEIARRFGVDLHESRYNSGYSHGHNRNLLDEEFHTTLLLNADVILQPDWLEILLVALNEVEKAGMAGGKLYRMDVSGQQVFRRTFPVLDSSGMFFTPSQRHFDRGSEEEDRGQYDRRHLVFGITGAALLCRKEMLEDLRLGDEYLDEDFFAYREDADLAWRAQLQGWKAVYEPQAVALHCRHVLPSRRRQLSALINYHSLKNRYLMRMKNLDPALRRHCFPYMWIRDLGILAYVLCFEWSSLAAYREVWRLRHKFRQKRQQVQQGRRVGPDALARWFSFTPAPLDP